MNPNEADHIGFCTICQTVHIKENSLTNRVCDNCGETAVVSLNQASDIINAYEALNKENELLLALTTGE